MLAFGRPNLKAYFMHDCFLHHENKVKILVETLRNDCDTNASFSLIYLRFCIPFRVSRVICRVQLTQRGPCDCFPSECCTGGESMAVPRTYSLTLSAKLDRRIPSYT